MPFTPGNVETNSNVWVQWMTDEKIDDWKRLRCILNVNLEYPEDLHNLHNDYPLAPERVKMGNVKKLILKLTTRLITLCIMKI